MPGDVPRFYFFSVAVLDSSVENRDPDMQFLTAGSFFLCAREQTECTRVEALNGTRKYSSRVLSVFELLLEYVCTRDRRKFYGFAWQGY